MLGRQTPWKPSQPAMTSHSSSRARAAVLEADPRPIGVEVVDADVGRLEQERETGVEPDPDEVLHDLRLTVDHDRASRP